MKKIIYSTTFIFLLLLLSCTEDISLLPTNNNPDALLHPNTILSIGSIPDVLDSVLSRAPADRLYRVNDFSDTLAVIPAAMVINGDDVTDPRALADSPLMTQLFNSGVRIVIGSNKNVAKANEIVGALGGVPFNGSYLTMIQQRGDTTAVTPVANTPGYRYDYLSLSELALIMGLSETIEDVKTTEATISPLSESELASAMDESDPLKNGRISAINAEPHWCSLKNRIPPTKYPLYGAWYSWRPEASKYYFSMHTIRKSLAYSFTVQSQNVLTDIVPGTGQITFRENTIKTYDRSKTYSTEIKIGVSGSLIPGVKNSAWFSQTETKSFSYSASYSSGYTIYSQSCIYACCKTQAQYCIRQNVWKYTSQTRGKAGIGYRVSSYYDKARFDKAKKSTVAWPVYCYDDASPILTTWRQRGFVYVELLFRVDRRGCNPKGCSAYKTCALDKPAK